MSVAVHRTAILTIFVSLFVLSSAIVSAETPDDQYTVAAAHYGQGRWDLAVKEFRTFLEKFPGDARCEESVFYLGNALLQLGKYNDARIEFQNYISRAPSGRFAREALFRVGEAAYLAGNYAAARPDLNGFLAKYPQDRLGAFVLPYLGEIALAGDDPASAAELFNRALKQFPDGILQDDCRLGLARAMVKQNKTEEAERLFRSVAEKANSPLAAAAQFHLGSLHYTAGDHQRAIECFAAFDDRFPGSPWRPNAQLGRGLSLLKLDRAAEAAAQFDAVLAAESAAALHERALRGKIAAALQTKDHDAVDRLTARFKNRFPAGPLLADVSRLAALSMVERKRYAEAVPLWEAFLASKPTGQLKATALGGAAISCARSGQIDKAKRYYAELITAAPQGLFLASITEQLADAAYSANEIAWSEELSKRLTAMGESPEFDFKGKLGLGWSQYKSGKPAEAAETFAALLKYGKVLPAETAAEAAFVLGRILEELGRNEEALAMYDRVIHDYPDAEQRPDAFWSAAQLLGKLKKHKQAADYYLTLVLGYPKSPKLDSILYELAWTASDMGDSNNATTIFQRIHDEFPASRFWADATCRAAQAALEQKDYQLADRLIEKLLAADAEPPVRQYAMELRGQSAVARGDWPQAHEAFEALLKEFPDTPRRLVAECWIAESYYRRDDLKPAAEKLDALALRVAVEREPWMAMIPLRRAQILARENKWTDAYRIASTIEADYPGFAQQYEADYLLGRCLANGADFDAARRMYKKVIDSPDGAKTETAAMAQWMIGETFFHQKQYDSALEAYLHLETLYAYPTWQAGALLQAGKCYEHLGKADEAARLYSRLIETYPRTQFVDRAKKRLEKTASL